MGAAARADADADLARLRAFLLPLVAEVGAVPMVAFTDGGGRRWPGGAGHDVGAAGGEGDGALPSAPTPRYAPRPVAHRATGGPQSGRQVVD